MTVPADPCGETFAEAAARPHFACCASLARARLASAAAAPGLSASGVQWRKRKWQH